MKYLVICIAAIYLLFFATDLYSQESSERSEGSIEESTPYFLALGLGAGAMTIMKGYFPQLGSWKLSGAAGYGPLRLEYSGLATGGNQRRETDSTFFWAGRTYREQRLALFYRFNYGVLRFGPGIGIGRIWIDDDVDEGRSVRRQSSTIPYAFEVATEWRYGGFAFQYCVVTSDFKPEQMYLLDIRFNLPLDLFTQ